MPRPTQVFGMPRRLALQVLFQAWALVSTRHYREAVHTDYVRLKLKTGKKAESLWDMKREELEELGYQELGMTRAQMQKETVVTLRERIRAQRKVVAWVQLEEDLAPRLKG